MKIFVRQIPVDPSRVNKAVYKTNEDKKQNNHLEVEKTYNLVITEEPSIDVQNRPFHGRGRHGSPYQLLNTLLSWFSTNKLSFTSMMIFTDRRD